MALARSLPPLAGFGGDFAERAEGMRQALARSLPPEGGIRWGCAWPLPTGAQYNNLDAEGTRGRLLPAHCRRWRDSVGIFAERAEGMRQALARSLPCHVGLSGDAPGPSSKKHTKKEGEGEEEGHGWSMHAVCRAGRDMAAWTGRRVSEHQALAHLLPRHAGFGGDAPGHSSQLLTRDLGEACRPDRGMRRGLVRPLPRLVVLGGDAPRPLPRGPEGLGRNARSSTTEGEGASSVNGVSRSNSSSGGSSGTPGTPT